MTYKVVAAELQLETIETDKDWARRELLFKMDIDKLFKVPKLPTSRKRQLPDNPTPETLKRMKMDPPAVPGPSTATSSQNGDSNELPTGKSRVARVEDEDADSEPGPSDFAPGGDADYFVEEDAEGRFFGGGLTEEQKKILNIFDGSGNEGVQDDFSELTTTAIRRLILRFERAMNKNQDQRSKYPNDPSKFIDSEADLDSAIKSLLPLAQAPKLAYPELVRSGTVAALIGLLSHENADIVIDVVEVVHELTDEDVGNEDDDDDEEDGREEALKGLVEALLENSLLELLVQNLTRLNEAEDSDRQGVFHILGIFENTLGFSPTLSARLVADTSILQWLLERINAKTHDENRGYAAEVLSILLQDNRESRLALGAKGGIETLLKVLSQFRKRDPVDADETEFMENVFDILCSALIEPETKDLFLQEEGVDLMLIMMKEKLQSHSRAIKVLDHALSGPSGTQNCQNFVEALGLKTLFSSFMGKSKKQKSAVTTPASEDTSHILGIITSLFSNLPSDSPPRVRLLAKFVEQTYEKVDRLLEIRESAESKLNAAEQEIEQERKDLVADGVVVGVDEQDTWYLRKLDSGLFTLQIVDSIIGWICMEDDGIREHVVMILGRKNKTLKDVVEVLKLYRDNVGDEETRISAESTDDATPSQRQILDGLMAFLGGS